MRSKIRLSLALPLTLLLLVGVALAAGTPSVDWKVTGAGGEHLEQGIYTLDNTLGQPVVGPISAGNIEICAGFMCGVDTIAPAAIGDLSASAGSTVGTVDLSWTAPGDDGSSGTASTYIVRYNTTQITTGNWGASTNVTGEPAPGPAGSAESMTVPGLTGGQTYWFAIRTRDDVPNLSGVSNSPSAMAAMAADTTAPAAITDLSASTGSAPGTVDLTWTAPGDDGNTGSASTYIVRYNPTQITAGNWGASTNVSGEPAPSPAGSAESMTVSGLTGGEGFWFASGRGMRYPIPRLFRIATEL